MHFGSIGFGYENYIYQAEYVRKWDQLARHGKLTGPQAQLAALTKPMEELYDSRTDPHMVNNLAGDPRHAGRLLREAVARSRCPSVSDAC